MTRVRRSARLVTLGLGLLSLAACGEEAAPSSGARATATPTEARGTEDDAERELLVFAATSLREAFGTMEQRFEAAHAGVDVTLQLAGTQELRAQLEAGAPADVLASADVASMEALRAAGRVGSFEIFARNEPVVVVSREASARLTSFALLPEAQRVVLGVPEVPIGRYAAAILENAERALGEGFRARVEEHVVSREPNVRLVLAKVAMGEAEAGIVYRTDAREQEDDTVLAIPAELNVIAEYPIASVEGAPHATLAGAWIAFVRSAEGQGLLAERGFLPVAAP